MCCSFNPRYIYLNVNTLLMRYANQSMLVTADCIVTAERLNATCTYLMNSSQWGLWLLVRISCWQQSHFVGLFQSIHYASRPGNISINWRVWSPSDVAASAASRTVLVSDLSLCSGHITGSLFSGCSEWLMNIGCFCFLLQEQPTNWYRYLAPKYCNYYTI